MDKEDADAPPALPDNAIVAEYHGAIYNRPMGRGIVLKDAPYASRGMYLDELIPTGDFEIDIVVRRKRVDHSDPHERAEPR